MNNSLCDQEPAFSSDRYSASRTRHHVTFFFKAPAAKQVFVIGDFNEWKPDAAPLSRQPDGCWTVGLELSHGHHQYLFLVDGEPRLDPNSSGTVRNERNERVSLIAVS